MNEWALEDFNSSYEDNIKSIILPHRLLDEYKITDCGVCKYSFYKTEDVIKRINNWNKPL